MKERKKNQTAFLMCIKYFDHVEDIFCIEKKMLNLDLYRLVVLKSYKMFCFRKYHEFESDGG